MNHHRERDKDTIHILESFLVLCLICLFSRLSRLTLPGDFLGEKSGPLRLVCLTSPLSRDDDWL